MDDVVLLHVVEGYEQLDGKPPNKPYRHPLKVIALDELV
jgi:hypothetical protein